MDGYSSATTLSIQRLECGREKRTKGPDVSRHACGHRGWVRSPSGTNRPMVGARVWRPRLPQAHVGSGPIVAGLEAAPPLSPARAIFTDTGRRTGQRCHGLTPGPGHAFDQGRTARAAHVGPAFGAQHDPRAARQPRALWLLCAPWPRDQIRRGLTTGLAGAPSLPGACTGRPDVAGRDAGRARARDALATARRAPCHARLGSGPTLRGGVERARPPNGGDHPPPLGGHAAPAPWSAILPVGPAVTGCSGLTRGLTPEAVPPLVALPRGHRQSPAPGVMDRCGVVSRPPAPGQHGLCRHAAPNTDAWQITPAQEPREGHHACLCRGPQRTEHGSARRREAPRTLGAGHEATCPTLGQVRGDGPDGTLMPTIVAGAIGVGARLAPVAGLPPKPILRLGCACVHPIVGLACLCSKY